MTTNVTGRRRLDIQGLRAIAVLLVVAYHAGLPVRGGFIGVDVFFVISGFVITGMLAREFSDHGRIRFGTFYLRRFKRLTPALTLMIAVTLLLSIALESPFGPQETTAVTGLAALVSVANFAIPLLSGGYFAAPAEANPLLNTWSLSVEEQFYFIFPAILLAAFVLMRRRGGGPGRGLAIVGALSVGSFALMILTQRWGAFPGDLLFGFYGPVGRAWEFGSGALLAIWLMRPPRLSSAMHSIAGVSGLALVLAAALMFDSSTVFPGLATLMPVLGTVLLIFAGSSPYADGVVSRFLSVRPMANLGDLSYSWYLWHWPLIVFALLIWPDVPWVGVAAALLSLAPAAASYHWVEQPLRIRSLPTRRSVAGLVLATAGPVLVLIGVTLVGSRAAWGQEWSSAAPAGISAATERGCHDEPFDPDVCTWETPGAEGSVLLVGDSQAHALSDGIIAAARQLDLSTTVTSQNACPLADVSRIDWNPRYAPEKAYCQPWNEEVIDFALATRPAVVVIANRSPLYVNADMDYATLTDKAGVSADTEAESSSMWREALTESVERLTQAGIPVLIAAEPPEGLAAKSLVRASLLLRDPEVPDRAVRIDAEALRDPAMKAEAAIAASDPLVRLWDPFQELCGETICPGMLDGVPLYSDGTHLSREGSRFLTSTIAQELASVLGGSESTATGQS